MNGWNTQPLWDVPVCCSNATDLLPNNLISHSTLHTVFYTTSFCWPFFNFFETCSWHHICNYMFLIMLQFLSFNIWQVVFGLPGSITGELFQSLFYLCFTQHLLHCEFSDISEDSTTKIRIWYILILSFSMKNPQTVDLFLSPNCQQVQWKQQKPASLCVFHALAQPGCRFSVCQLSNLWAISLYSVIKVCLKTMIKCSFKQYGTNSASPKNINLSFSSCLESEGKTLKTSTKKL